MSALKVDPDLHIGRIAHDHVRAFVTIQITDVERPAALVALRQRKECQPAAPVRVIGGRLVQREHAAAARLAFEHENLRAGFVVHLSERNGVRRIEREALLGPEFLLVGRESNMDGVIAFGIDNHKVLGPVAVDVQAPDQPGSSPYAARAPARSRPPGKSGR